MPGNLHLTGRSLLNVFMCVRFKLFSLHRHYFAYCRKSDDVRSDWQLFDDASVRVVGGNEVMKHAEVDSAYTLMFVRKNEI